MPEGADLAWAYTPVAAKTAPKANVDSLMLRNVDVSGQNVRKEKRATVKERACV
jgi:hypothetical protein